MPTSAAPLLAKLTRPRLHDVLPRERLFDLLDDARERRRAICVVGPPGAGKTTLIATWLEERGLVGPWFQVDPGDTDLATFFYYLGLAAAPFDAPDRRPLPLLTPEYLGDVAGFSRRFFRELFARLPTGATLVLDNYQEVAAEHPFHGLIAQAIEEVPPGATLIAISRRDPPDAYARMIANEHVALVEWDDLKVTADEARRIGARRSSITGAALDRIHRESGGWMAGLTLLLERASRSAASVPLDASEPPQRVFDYFATQILAEATEIQRQILRKLALVPRTTARMAQALTGEPEAGPLLDLLYRRRLFTDRRGGEAGSYTFHALFRAFLRHGAEAALGPAGVAQIQRQGAHLLEAEGLAEDAMELYLAAPDWHAAARLVVAQAGAMLAAGRWQTVADWVRALPGDVMANDPWLHYWAGAAQVAIAPPAARDALAAAHRTAVIHGDAMCQIQCAAAIIESCCIEWSRFSLMDPWIPVLERAFDDTLPWPSPDARLRAMNALLSALAYRAPEHPLRPLCVERTLAFIPAAADPNIKVVAASTLVNHGGHSAQPRITRDGMAVLEQWIDDPALTMPNRAAGLFSLLWGRYSTRDFRGANAAVTALERLAEDTGLAYAGTFSAFLAVFVEGARGHGVAARQWFEKLLQRAGPGRWYDRSIVCCAAGGIGIYERNPALTLEYGEEGIALIADGVANSAIQWRWPVAAAYAHRGDAAQVHRRLADIRVFIDKHRMHHWEPVCRAIEALLAFSTGDRIAVSQALADMLRLHRGVEESNLWYLSAYLSDLFAVALDESIDPDEVRRLIQLYRLPAPSPLAESWPWPVRVRLFGRFALEIDGAPAPFPRKVPRRPLMLLRALACFGGQDVPIAKLADALWPDLDGDDAIRSFQTTLFRLRHLLQIEDALVLADGRLSLDRDQVWVDSLVFEDLCAAAETGDVHAATRARHLYGSPLLDGEDHEPWVMAARERCARAHSKLGAAGRTHP
jgi:hypothetical protein